MKAQVTDKQTIGQGNWLILSELTYIDDGGKQRTWEMIERPKNKCKGAVAIIAYFVRENAYLFVEQFRPPTNQRTIEFTAGCIDPNESIEQAAIRELYEETGYRGTIRFIAPSTYSSLGMSNETITLVKIDIDTQLPENQDVKAHPDDGEYITQHIVPEQQLSDFLLKKHADKAIDNKIIAYFFDKLNH